MREREREKWKKIEMSSLSSEDWSIAIASQAEDLARELGTKAGDLSLLALILEDRLSRAVLRHRAAGLRGCLACGSRELI